MPFRVFCQKKLVSAGVRVARPWRGKPESIPRPPQKGRTAESLPRNSLPDVGARTRGESLRFERGGRGSVLCAMEEGEREMRAFLVSLCGRGGEEIGGGGGEGDNNNRHQDGEAAGRGGEGPAEAQANVSGPAGFPWHGMLAGQLRWWGQLVVAGEMGHVTAAFPLHQNSSGEAIRTLTPFCARSITAGSRVGLATDEDKRHISGRNMGDPGGLPVPSSI